MSWVILQGDARQIPLADASVQCVVTSPPYYGLRDYGTPRQIGLESSLAAYLRELLVVFAEVRRVLRDDGTLWLNLGDSYWGSWGNYGGQNRGQGTQRPIITGSKAHQRSYDDLARWRPPTASTSSIGLKNKDLCGVPWRVAFMLQDMGFYLRSDIIWHKPNPMPESVQDRPTKSHEMLFLLTKSEKYFYDADAIAEPVTFSSIARLSQPTLHLQPGSPRVPGKTNGNMKAVGGITTRNARSVWTIATEAFSDAHFAVMPTALVERCVKSGCPTGGVVFDPFAGAGTVPLVADRLGRQGIGLELNRTYCEMAHQRIAREVPLFAAVVPRESEQLSLLAS